MVNAISTIVIATPPTVSSPAIVEKLFIILAPTVPPQFLFLDFPNKTCPSLHELLSYHLSRQFYLVHLLLLLHNLINPAL